MSKLSSSQKNAIENLQKNFTSLTLDKIVAVDNTIYAFFRQSKKELPPVAFKMFSDGVFSPTLKPPTVFEVLEETIEMVSATEQTNHTRPNIKNVSCDGFVATAGGCLVKKGSEALGHYMPGDPCCAEFYCVDPSVVFGFDIIKSIFDTEFVNDEDDPIYKIEIPVYHVMEIAREHSMFLVTEDDFHSLVEMGFYRSVKSPTESTPVENVLIDEIDLSLEDDEEEQEGNESQYDIEPDALDNAQAVVFTDEEFFSSVGEEIKALHPEIEVKVRSHLQSPSVNIFWLLVLSGKPGFVYYIEFINESDGSIAIQVTLSVQHDNDRLNKVIIREIEESIAPLIEAIVEQPTSIDEKRDRYKYLVCNKPLKRIEDPVEWAVNTLDAFLSVIQPEIDNFQSLRQKINK